MIDRCPHALVRAESLEICQYASILEVGILPLGGGLEDQSSTFVDALTWASSVKCKLEQERFEKGRS